MKEKRWGEQTGNQTVLYYIGPILRVVQYACTQCDETQTANLMLRRFNLLSHAGWFASKAHYDGSEGVAKRETQTKTDKT